MFKHPNFFGCLAFLAAFIIINDMGRSSHMNYREYSGQYASADIRSGTVYSYRIYVPNIFSEAELAVLVTHDGLNEAEAEGMARLYEEKDCLLYTSPSPRD